MKADELYRGEAGSRYHALRAARRSDAVQKNRATIFADLTTRNAIVADFGCGTGRLLQSLDAKSRIGIEINEMAAAEATQHLDAVHRSLSEIPDESVDVVISYHALEHVDAPAAIVSDMRRILRPGGTLRIVVPCEMPLLLASHRSWKPGDDDMHLFTWSPLTLGNLLHVAGFEHIEADVQPNSEGGRLGSLFAQGTAGRRFFSFLKALRHGRFHTRATARKPAAG